MKAKHKKIWIAGGATLLFLLIAGKSRGATGAGNLLALSYLNVDGLPSGMRRNNPGNIVRGIGYHGEVFLDAGRFAQFQSWVYGIRAMIVLLRKYIVSGSSYPNGCVTSPQNTVRLIVMQYAPKQSCGGDNPDDAVESYIQYVSNRMGVSANAILSPTQATLRKLVRAMAHYEQGRECVTDAEFDYAYKNLL